MFVYSWKYSLKNVHSWLNLRSMVDFPVDVQIKILLSRKLHAKLHYQNSFGKITLLEICVVSFVSLKETL